MANEKTNQDVISLQEAEFEIIRKSIRLLKDLDKEAYLRYAPMVIDMCYKYDCQF